MLKKLFIILLSIILAVSCVGCSDRLTKTQIDGRKNVTDFCMYSYYGDNDFAKFISSAKLKIVFQSKDSKNSLLSSSNEILLFSIFFKISDTVS